MPQSIMMTQFHIDVYAPRNLSDAEVRAVRRTINGKPFMGAMQRALRSVRSRYPSLRKVRIAISN